MNIGNLIKLIGDVQPAASRALELRPGQTVRAQVLELTGDGEALLQIGGTQLVAKLETPLKQGQTALLQVQAETPEGMLILKKQEQGRTVEVPAEQVWKELAGKFGLGSKDQAGQALLRELKAAGVVINSETAALLEKAASIMPKGENSQQWLKAAASIIQRGLPVTEATLTAMRQILSGPPLHELLDELTAALEDNSASEGGQAGDASRSAARLLAFIKEAAYAAGAGLGKAASPALVEDLSQAGRETAGKNVAAAGKGLEPEQPARAAMTSQEQPAKPSLTNQEQFMRTALANQEQTMRTARANQVLPQGAGKEAQAGSVAAAGDDQQQPVTGGKRSDPAAGAAASAAGKASQDVEGDQGQAPWPRKLLDWLGASHENKLMRSLGRSEPGEDFKLAPAETPHRLAQQEQAQRSEGRAGSSSGPGLPPAPEHSPQQRSQPLPAMQGTAAAGQSAELDVAKSDKLGQPAGGAAPASEKPGLAALPHRSAPLESAVLARGGQDPEQAKAAAESLMRTGFQAGSAEDAGGEAASLKSALLSLLQASDGSPRVKEAAQQLLQHITGQQLLLSPERSGAFFSQLTLQIPIQTPGGAQTASVHVQSRRSAKGGLDASNCRLLFDLRLQAIGDTVVDVAVADKVVSLTVFSGHPAVPSLTEAGKPALSELLQASGYRLLGMKVVHPDERRLSQQSDGQEQTLPAVEEYKGVDMRV